MAPSADPSLDAKLNALRGEDGINVAVRNTYSATRRPTAADDANAGWSAGSVWLDTVHSEVWVCLNPAPGAATWRASASPTAGGIGPGEVWLFNGTVQTFTTIAAAIAAAGAGDTIVLGPGSYAESFTIPSLVTVVGWPSKFTTLITGAAPTGTRVTLTDPWANLINCSVQVPTDAVPAILANPGAGSVVMVEGCFLYNVPGASLASGITKSGLGDLRVVDVNWAGGDVATLFEITAGLAIFERCGITENGSIGTVVLMSGGEARVDRLLMATGSITDGFALAGGDLFVSNADTRGLPTNAVHVTADGVHWHGHHSTLLGATLDWLVDPALTGAGTVVVNTFCDFRVERLTFPAAFVSASGASILSSFEDDGDNNDPATRVIGDLAVGMPEVPKPSAFGEGDSSVTGLFVFSHDGAGGWVDNTAAARSRAGSTFDLFQDVLVNHEAYIGSTTRTFPGIQADITAAMVLGAGTVIPEYWNGGAWVPFVPMFSDAEAPYAQRAGLPLSVVASEHMRFGAMPGWASTTVNGQAGFWIRVRITVGITTVPTLERIKLHTNRAEFNRDGFPEFFGAAEPRRALSWHKNTEDDLTGSSPSNGTIALSANVSLDTIDNQFADNVVDGNGGLVRIPNGLDTSRPLEFEILWYSLANGAPSDVELEMDVVQVRVGDTINGTLAETSLAQVIAVGAADQNILKKTTFELDVSELVPGELVAFSYFRDAQVGNGDDTLGAAINIVTTSLFGYFWH